MRSAFPGHLRDPPQSAADPPIPPKNPNGKGFPRVRIIFPVVLFYQHLIVKTPEDIPARQGRDEGAAPSGNKWPPTSSGLSDTSLSVCFISFLFWGVVRCYVYVLVSCFTICLLFCICCTFERCCCTTSQACICRGRPICPLTAVPRIPPDPCGHGHSLQPTAYSLQPTTPPTTGTETARAPLPAHRCPRSLRLGRRYGQSPYEDYICLRFDSIIMLILRDGISRPIRNFPESLSQAILAGKILVGRLGVSPQKS